MNKLIQIVRYSYGANWLTDRTSSRLHFGNAAYLPNLRLCREYCESGLNRTAQARAGRMMQWMIICIFLDFDYKDSLFAFNLVQVFHHKSNRLPFIWQHHTDFATRKRWDPMVILCWLLISLEFEGDWWIKQKRSMLSTFAYRFLHHHHRPFVSGKTVGF